jgi:hypothetical protein
MKHERWTAEDVAKLHREEVDYRLKLWDRMVEAAEPRPMPPLFRALGPFERARRYLTPKRVLCVALVAASLAVGGFLGGCAGIAPDEGWRRTHSPLPAKLVPMRGAELQLLCRTSDGARHQVYYGCVIRDYNAGHCEMFMEPDPPAWLLAHEMRHCDGWSHA